MTPILPIIPNRLVLSLVSTYCCSCSRIRTRATLQAFRNPTTWNFLERTLMRMRSRPPPRRSISCPSKKLRTPKAPLLPCYNLYVPPLRCLIYFLRYVLYLQFRGYATPMLLSELQRHFPNRKITTFLLSYYFDKSSVHWLFPVIHRPCFEAYYRTFSSGPLPPPIEFIALLAITCATALQFLPETDEDVRFFVSLLMFAC
jgi:hypothetical protein